MGWTVSEPKKIKAWGGFSSGRLDMREMDDKWGGENKRMVPAIFRNRKEARRQYQDVRRVEIRQVPR